MNRDDRVVLLHGLGRSNLSLVVPQVRLRAAGFEPLNVHYPSRARPIEELASLVAARLPEDGGGRLHFLTHSMGGIVVRYLLSVRRPSNLGRVVMLSPPNRGSQLASRLKSTLLYRLLTGPSGQQIGADPLSLPNRLGPVDFELGVITGNRTFNPTSHLIRGESDGKVAVEEARVHGMSDFLVVRRGHAFIMNDPSVLDQAIHFFRHGRFAR